MERKKLTKETHDKFVAEKKQLKDKLPAAIQAKAEAAAHGDLTENFEYVAACDELNRLKRRIAEIEAILSSSVVIEEIPTDKIGIGSYFTAVIYGGIKNGSMDCRLVQSVYEVEALLDLHYISIDSKLGEAVYGKKVGEVFACDGPKGDRITGQISSITNEKEINPADKTLVK